ncbi:hypothetical protein AYI68_g2520 [Smittium mucronatum]|uniref:Uncharacterized protein n=1 Tax=Smittium mucronatum TaxID=133383 RepID=A0A1R0H2K4_9FUNG|nr:hypothetical protein AYI68_g2520 [Smittium mucronatum]
MDLSLKKKNNDESSVAKLLETIEKYRLVYMVWISQFNTNMSAFFALLLTKCTDDQVKDIFDDSRFMASLPMYFNLSDVGSRLSATVLAEIITKRYSSITSINKTESVDNNESENYLDFGIDYVISMGEDAIKSKKFNSNSIGESIMVKQIRELSNSNLSLEELSNNSSSSDLLFGLGLNKIFNLGPQSMEEQSQNIQSKIFGKTICTDQYGDQDYDPIYGKRPDSYLPDETSENLPEFVQRRVPVFLRDVIKILRSNSSEGDWELQSSIMRDLPSIIITSDQNDIKNVGPLLIATLLKISYMGPEYLGDVDEASIGAGSGENLQLKWDQTRQTCIVCLGLKAPSMVFSVLTKTILSKDLSVVDRSVALSSISAISLTFSGTLDLPEQFYKIAGKLLKTNDAANLGLDGDEDSINSIGYQEPESVLEERGIESRNDKKVGDIDDAEYLKNKYHQQHEKGKDGERSGSD